MGTGIKDSQNCVTLTESFSRHFRKLRFSICFSTVISNSL